MNWIHINDRFKQCISSMASKHINNLSHLYINDVLQPAGQHIANTRASLLKLKHPLQVPIYFEENRLLLWRKKMILLLGY